MEKRKAGSVCSSFLKATATVVSAVFFCTTIVWAVPSPEILLTRENSAAREALDITELNIPRDVGKITDLYVSGKKKPFILYLQDAHCNVEAQENISAIIEHVSSKMPDGESPVIALEGTAAQEIDHSIISAFPDDSIRRAVSDFFLKRGLIDGAEHYATRVNPETRLFGIEDEAAYRENSKLFLDALPYQKDAFGTLVRIRKRVEALKSRVYSGHIRTLDKKITDFRSRELSLVEHTLFLKRLSEKKRLDLKDFVTFNAFLELIRLERRLDVSKIERELNGLNLDSEFVRGLLLSKGSFVPDFCREIIKKFRKIKIDFKKYPALSAYLDYLNKMSSVEGVRLFSEIEAIQTLLMERLYRNSDQSVLTKVEKKLRITENIARFELLPEQFDYYLKNEAAMRVKDLILQVDKLSFRYGFGGFSVRHERNLEKYLDLARKFYGAARARDASLMNNLEAVARENDATVIFLVTGGFHRGGIERGLKERGFSYAVIAPRFVPKEEDKARYFRQLEKRDLPLTAEYPRGSIKLTSEFTVPEFRRQAMFLELGLCAVKSAGSLGTDFYTATRKFADRFKIKEADEFPSKLWKFFTRTKRKGGICGGPLNPQTLAKLGLACRDSEKPAGLFLLSKRQADGKYPWNKLAPSILDSLRKKIPGTGYVEINIDGHDYAWVVFNVAPAPSRTDRSTLADRGASFDAVDTDAARQAAAGADFQLNPESLLGINFGQNADARRQQPPREDDIMIEWGDGKEEPLDSAKRQQPDPTATLRFTDHAKDLMRKMPDLLREYPRLTEFADDYEILKVLGKGAMGIVLLARHRHFDELRALKIMQRLDSEEEIKRFRVEARVARKLDHPNIASVNESGTKGGMPYLTMDYIEGEDLESYIGRADVDLTDILEIMKKVCRAMDYAHENGVLHRDIKPANIMVQINERINPEGEAVKEAVPFVTDFGLARDESAERSRMTKTGDTMGTPVYMSPEQAMGERENIDYRSDIWSLGASLYYLATYGKLPFTGSTSIVILRKILEEDPEGLLIHKDRMLERWGDVSDEKLKELEKIILKALRKEKDKRYQTAGEMADDIERFLGGKKVEAKAPTVLEKAHSFYKRNKVLVSAGLVVLLCMVIAVPILVSMKIEADRIEAERFAAEEDRKKAEAEKLAARRELEAKEAAEMAYWGEAIFKDDFERESIGDDWKVLRGGWRIVDGDLEGRITDFTNAYIIYERPIIGDVRISYRAKLGEKGSIDMSTFICASEGDPLKGYILAVGREPSGKQTFVTLVRENNVVTSNACDIEVGENKWRDIIVEMRDNVIRVFIDGNLVLDYMDRRPLRGEGIGFYTKTPSTVRFAGIKVWSPNSLLEHAKVLIEEEKYGEFWRQIDYIEENYPDSDMFNEIPVLLYERGNDLFLNYKSEEGLPFLLASAEKALTRPVPELVECNALLVGGFCCVCLGKYDKARGLFYKIINEHPNRRDQCGGAYYGLASIEVKLGELGAARRLIERELSNYSDIKGRWGELKYLLGIILALQGEYESAREHWGKICLDEKTYVKTKINSARAAALLLADRGNLEAAFGTINVALNAITMESANERWSYRLLRLQHALILQRMGRTQEAQVALREIPKRFGPTEDVSVIARFFYGDIALDVLQRSMCNQLCGFFLGYKKELEGDMEGARAYYENWDCGDQLDAEYMHTRLFLDGLVIPDQSGGSGGENSGNSLGEGRDFNTLVSRFAQKLKINEREFVFRLRVFFKRQTFGPHARGGFFSPELMATMGIAPADAGFSKACGMFLIAKSDDGNYPWDKIDKRILRARQAVSDKRPGCYEVELNESGKEYLLIIFNAGRFQGANRINASEHSRRDFLRFVGDAVRNGFQNGRRGDARQEERGWHATRLDRSNLAAHVGEPTEIDRRSSEIARAGAQDRAARNGAVQNGLDPGDDIDDVMIDYGDGNEMPLVSRKGHQPFQEADTNPPHANEASVKDPAKDLSALMEQYPGLAKFSKYEIRRVLASGGMGIVLEARHKGLNKRVAMKVIRPELTADTENVGRFIREARVAAGLRHPHIVPVLDVGFEHGLHYMIMEFIEGKDFDKFFERRRTNIREVLEIMEKTCRGLHHAHEEGIIHRDIKPQNIIVDRKGTPYITDFGLANFSTQGEDEEKLTRQGDILGTPQYMPREQVDTGEDEQVDARSDVYALGVTLYKVISDGLPYDGSSPLVIFTNILQHDPEPLHTWKSAIERKWGSYVPKDVETIIEKAIRVKQENRYQNAAEMADDIRRFLDGEPIHARPMTALEKLNRFTRRHFIKIAAAFLGLVAVAGTVIGVMLMRAAEELERQRQEAEARRLAEQAAVEAFWGEAVYEGFGEGEELGENWTIREGVWTLREDGVLEGRAEDEKAWIEFSKQTVEGDVKVEYEAKLPDSGSFNAGAVICMTEDEFFYSYLIDVGVDSDGSGSKIVLLKGGKRGPNRITAREVQSCKIAMSPADGSWHKIRFERKGNIIRIYFDGDLVIEYADREPLFGDKVALYTESKTGGVLYRNVKIYGPSALLGFARKLFEEEKYEDCLRVIDRIEEEYAGTDMITSVPGFLYESGSSLFDADNYSVAEKFFLRCKKSLRWEELTLSTQGNTYHCLAQCALFRKDYGKAVEFCNFELDNFAESRWHQIAALNLLGIIALNQGNNLRAKEFFQRAMDDRGRNPADSKNKMEYVFSRVRLNLGTVNFLEGNTREAVRIFANITDDIELADCYRNEAAANFLILTSRLDYSLTRVKKEKLPQMVDSILDGSCSEKTRNSFQFQFLYIQKALILVMLGERDEARETLLEFRHRDNTAEQLYFISGELLKALDNTNYEIEEENFRRNLPERSLDFYLGMMREIRGDREGAFSDYNNYLELPFSYYFPLRLQAQIFVDYHGRSLGTASQMEPGLVITDCTKVLKDFQTRKVSGKYGGSNVGIVVLVKPGEISSMEERTLKWIAKRDKVTFLTYPKSINELSSADLIIIQKRMAPFIAKLQNSVTGYKNLDSKHIVVLSGEPLSKLKPNDAFQVVYNAGDFNADPIYRLANIDAARTVAGTGEIPAFLFGANGDGTYSILSHLVNSLRVTSEAELLSQKAA